MSAVLLHLMHIGLVQSHSTSIGFFQESDTWVNDNSFPDYRIPPM